MSMSAVYKWFKQKHKNSTGWASVNIFSSLRTVTNTQSSDEEEQQECTEPLVTTVAQEQIYYNELR